MTFRSLRPERYSRLGNYLLLLVFLSAEYLKKCRKCVKSIQKWYSNRVALADLYILILYNKLVIVNQRVSILRSQVGAPLSVRAMARGEDSFLPEKSLLKATCQSRVFVKHDPYLR